LTSHYAHNSRFPPHIIHFQSCSPSETSSPKVGHEWTNKASDRKSLNSQQCQKPELQLTKLRNMVRVESQKFVWTNSFAGFRTFFPILLAGNQLSTSKCTKALLRSRRNGICPRIEYTESTKVLRHTM
jgi:hypothetical protein